MHHAATHVQINVCECSLSPEFHIWFLTSTKVWLFSVPRISVLGTPPISLETRFLASGLKNCSFQIMYWYAVTFLIVYLAGKKNCHTSTLTASAELYYNHCLNKHCAIYSISSVSLWAMCIMIHFSVLPNRENMGVRRSWLCEEASVPVYTGFARAGTFWNGWAGCQLAHRCGSRLLAPCPAGTRSGPGCPWCGRLPAGPSLGTHSHPSPERTRAGREGGWK